MDADARSDAGMHAFAVQKQAVQQQLMEIDLALKELTGASTAYRLVGGLMVGAPVETLKADLEKKKEVLDARMQSIERQHEKLSAKPR